MIIGGLVERSQRLVERADAHGLWGPDRLVEGSCLLRSSGRGHGSEREGRRNHRIASRRSTSLVMSAPERGDQVGREADATRYMAGREEETS
jgi:hypothetical protein